LRIRSQFTIKRVKSKLTEPWEDQIQLESEGVMESKVANNTVTSYVQKDPYSEISFLESCVREVQNILDWIENIRTYKLDPL
jgi:hypothetical protein